MSSLSRVVAVARVHGPQAGLGALDALESDRRIAGYHRLLATRAHLLGLAGQHGPAAAAYRDAARRATSVPERRYLSRMAAEQADQAEASRNSGGARRTRRPPVPARRPRPALPGAGLAEPEQVGDHLMA